MMALARGTRLGPYEIEVPIGAGGMGEVYRARDPRFERDVAIKVLPPAFAADADRLRRFEQEARTTGALNHPNILTVFDLGTHEGSPYLVCELLEGQTLRERVQEGVLPQRKAIDYAQQTARGLAAAHTKGIVHRDLKPENLYITKDGRVKILDFGLARVVGGDATRAETVTQEGTILGTVGYMAPEQVRGQPADARSDLFAFGAILYEMLGGRRAFGGGSAADVLSAILKEEPPELATAGMGLERIVRRCLEKNPEERFQSASDVAFALETMSGVATPSAAVPAPSRRWMPIAVVAAVAVGLAAAFWAGWSAAPVPVPTFHRLTFRRGVVLSARFAPEGQSVVYGASWDGQPPELFSARPGSPESRSLGLPNADVVSIASSGEMALLANPMNRLTGNWEAQALSRASLAGGGSREVVKEARVADWSPDGKSLAVVRVVEGRNRIEFPMGAKLYETADFIGALRVSPDGTRLAFAERPQGFGTDWSIAVLDRGGAKRSLGSGGTGDFVDLAWGPDGKEIWYDARLGGEPEVRAVTLTGRHRVVARIAAPVRLFDIAADGRVLLARLHLRAALAGVPPGERQERDLSWLDSTELDGLTPDGKTLVVTEFGEGGGAGRWSVYLRKVDGSPAVRLGEGQAFDLSPDGLWVLSMRRSTPPQLVLLPTGAGEAVTLQTGRITDFNWAAWLPDGRRVLFNGAEPGRNSRIWALDVPGGAPRPITPEGTTIQLGVTAIPPNGRAVAAQEVRSRKVLLYPLEGGEPREIHGAEPQDRPAHWSSDGRFLYVVGAAAWPARVYRIELSTGRRELWKEIVLADPAGVTGLWGVRLAAGETAYYYSYMRELSDLYVVEGLR